VTVPVFLLGLGLGALFGGGTFAASGVWHLAIAVGVLFAVLTWLGNAFINLITPKG
jgi:hypothetical protein